MTMVEDEGEEHDGAVQTLVQTASLQEESVAVSSFAFGRTSHALHRPFALAF
jgi:hypothetical protein